MRDELRCKTIETSIFHVNGDNLLDPLIIGAFEKRATVSPKKLCHHYSRLSHKGHLYKTDTSVTRTPRVGPCPSLLPLFNSL